MRSTRLLLAGLLAVAAPVSAATIVVDAIDSGQYRGDIGIHLPSNENYQTGMFAQIERRSFVVFDLSAINGTVNSAKLRLFNPELSQFQHGYVSPDAAETLNLYDVTTPALDIVNNTAGLPGFNDLGSGVLFGSRSVSAADNGTVIETILNSNAISALNSASGLFVIGGALSTISGTADQYVFGFSMASFVSDHTRQLVLDVTPAAAIPEPSSATYGLLGILAILASWLIRNKAH